MLMVGEERVKVQRVEPMNTKVAFHCKTPPGKGKRACTVHASRTFD